MDLVYLTYWTLNLMPLMVYPKGLFNLNFSIKNLMPDNASVSTLGNTPACEHVPTQKG